MRKNSKKLTSKSVREDPLLLRNDFFSDNKFGIPLVRKNDIDVSLIRLMGFDKIKTNETINFDKTIHFFLDDYKFKAVYSNPKNYPKKLAQYQNVMTPDFSLYTDMPLAKQIDAVFNNRWCGAYWQEMGLSVIPTISWGDYDSYEFSFLGVEKGSIVAVSTNGARKGKFINEFLDGYNEMMRQIEPNVVLCYDEPFKEMSGNILAFKYLEITGRAS